jgi:putative ABC transport system permease protein
MWRLYAMCVDEDFVGMFGLDLLSGRNLPDHTPPDSAQAFLLNASAVRALGWGESGTGLRSGSGAGAIGKRIRWSLPDRTMVGHVVGVIADFHSRSLRTKIEPMIFCKYPEGFRSLLFRIDGGMTSETLGFLNGDVGRASAGPAV